MRPGTPGRRLIGIAATVTLAAAFAVAGGAASPTSVENPHPWVAIEHPHPWCYTCHSSW
jgi:hypothetical protein